MNSIGKIVNGKYQEFANTKQSQEINTEEIKQEISKIKNDVSKKVSVGGDISENIITFEQASVLANVQSGDSVNVVLGKLSKLYSALETGVLSDIGIENNVTPNKLIISDSNGKLIPWHEVALDDLKKLNGINENVQVQIDVNKQGVADNKKDIESLVTKTDELQGKCFRIEDFGKNGESFTKENLQILLHNRIRILAQKVAKNDEIQVAYCGLWPNVTWIVGQLTLMGQRSPGDYIATAYTSSGGYVGYGDYTTNTMTAFIKLNEVSNTTSAPWLKTWSANEWREAGGNLPAGVTYGHVIRIFGNDEPGIGSKSDTSFQLFAHVNSSKSNLYTAYQSTRGSTTLPWVLSGGGTTKKQLEVNGELIGENNVRMSVYGDLRIINGYIRITVPIKKGDKLVYIDLEDSPPVPQWSTSTHFSKPGEARSGSMNLTITQKSTYIYVNDDYPVSIGMYNIDFVYTVT
ncbi:MAG: hypothetical protein HFG89_00235 [Dorea sp.]|nr:hypothetical protein [Dorea sp.]